MASWRTWQVGMAEARERAVPTVQNLLVVSTTKTDRWESYTIRNGLFLTSN